MPQKSSVFVRWWLAALICTAVAGLEPGAFLADLKRRMLADMGMERVPDMRLVNTSGLHLSRMTRRYWRRVARAAHEDVTLHAAACSNDSLVFLLPPPLEDEDSTVQWARLRLPDATYRPVHASLFRLHTSTHITLPCSQCCGSTLRLHTSTSTRRRSEDEEEEVAKRERRRRGGRSTRRARRRRRRRSEQQKGGCAKRRKGCCRRESLRVNFKEIGWDWIVQPKEFDAFFCKGRCSADDQFASTHALVQSIVNAGKGKGRAGRPCCAPRRLKPLDLLHYDDRTPPQLVVTRQKGMIVRECACT